MPEFPGNYANALFERVLLTREISTAAAFIVTLRIRAPAVSDTLRLIVANPPGLNALMENISVNSNADAMRYPGM